VPFAAGGRSRFGASHCASSPATSPTTNDIDTIAAIDRDVAEDYTVWLAARLGHAARCR
jgi:hypothetical protein